MYPIIPAPHIPPVEDGYSLSAAAAGNMTPQFKNDAQGPRAIPVMMPSTDAAVQYTSMMPQVRKIPVLPSKRHVRKFKVWW